MSTHLVLMGAPGSGKGTFSQTLLETKAYYHLSLGAILRKEIFDDTPLGQEIKPFVQTGKLIPFSLGVDLFKKHFEIASQSHRFVIVDGMVQNEAYAEFFKQFFLDKKVAYVFLKASREVCLNRLQTRKTCSFCFKVYSSNDQFCCDHPLEKRSDDSDSEAGRRRLDRFFDFRIKLLDIYKDVRFIEIDSDQPLEKLKPLYRSLFIDASKQS